MGPVDAPVLIVGAGPVGLTASLLLAQSGIANLVVERRDGPHRAPQAHVINPRSLEICRSIGMDMNALEAAATPPSEGAFVSWRTSLFGEELGRVPYERQGDENLYFTPTPLRNLPQHRFEPLLLAHAREQPEIEVRYGHTWIESGSGSDTVTSVIQNGTDGRSYEVRSRYLLAADGAGSTVRKASGIEMLGPDMIDRFVMVHFAVDLREQLGPSAAIMYWVMAPEAIGTFVAHDTGGSWVFMQPYRDGEDYGEEACRKRIHRAMGRDDIDFAIHDIGRWTMTAQVATAYRDANTFLIGDSAHRFPPTGGMGMNTGMQDAHNLAWKIAAIEHGWADASLLDSYEIERRPVAQNNADQSLNNAMKMWEVVHALGILPDDEEGSHARMQAALADPEARRALAAAIENQRPHFDMFGLHLGFAYEAGVVIPDGTPPVNKPDEVSAYTASSRPGSRLPHAWIERAGKRCSSLDLAAYDRFTLLLAEKAVAAEYKGRVPLQVFRAGKDFHDPQGHWKEVCGIQDDGALLVRPDGHVAWRGRAPQPDAVMSQLLGS